jgi:hypothetical protein
MIKLMFLALLLIMPQGKNTNTRKQGEERNLAGVIYFTNDTPRNLNIFPVELYTRNQKRRLAATKADARGNFNLTGIKAGKYLLKLTWPPDRCTLWYNIDVTTDSNTSISVIMDAACSGHNGNTQELPKR